MEQEVLIAPPQSPEAERAVLGSAMISEDASRWLSENLTAEMFYQDQHKAIFKAIQSVMENGGTVDIITLVESLRSSNKLGEVGGIEVLKVCPDSVAHASHVAHYGRIVKLSFLERRLLKAMTKAKDPMQREEALGEVYEICRERDMLAHRGGITMGDALHLVVDGIDKGPADIMKTGIVQLDKVFGGMEGGDLLTLGARTGAGKTATLLSMAVNIAKSGKRVAFFAGEMGGEQVAKRALSQESCIDHWKLRERRLNKDDLRSILEASGRLSKLPIFFCTIPSPSIKDIMAFSASTKADCVIVDYLTRCRLPQAESMRLQVSHFMVALKNFARETEKRVLLAAQINRATDKSDSPPKLSDLRESGAIEEESDVVVLLYLNEEARYSDGPVTLSMAVAKNRHGRVGSVDVPFNKPIMLVGDRGTVTTPMIPEIVHALNGPREDRAKLAANDKEVEDVPF